MSRAAAMAMGGVGPNAAAAAANPTAGDRAVEEAPGLEDRLINHARYGCELLCSQVDDGSGPDRCTVGNEIYIRIPVLIGLCFPLELLRKLL